MTSHLESLLAWEKELLAEQEGIARELEPLLTRKEEIRTKLELVQRLKALEGNGRSVRSDSQTVKAPGSVAPTTIGSELQAAVRQILETRAKPMHVRDLRSALTERGIPIPGKGTDANVIVHLRRLPQVFSRTGRGTYGLAEWKVQRRSKVT